MTSPVPGSRVVIVDGDAGGFAQRITAGPYELRADELPSDGGTGSGPDSYQLLLSSLGSCTSMTVAMYARRKGWPLTRVRVALSHAKIWVQDCEHCDTRDGRIDRIERAIELHGELSAEQRSRLLEIADKCPVHRTLTSEIDIVTREVPAGAGGPAPV